MAEYKTTTSELLNNLVINLKEFKAQHLYSVEGFYIGVVKAIPIFPLIALVPVQQRIIGARNDNTIDVARRIRFDVYTNKLDSTAAFNQGLGIINTLKQLFKPSYNGEGYKVCRVSGEATVKDVKVINEQFSEGMPYNNGFLQYAYLEMDFISNDTIVDLPKVVESKIRTTQAKELIEVIKDTFREYKGDYLTDIVSFKCGVLPPAPQYPLVFVTSPNEDVERRFTSADSGDRSVQVFVISKALVETSMLLDNLDLADKVLNVIYANQYFGGRVYDFSFPVADYGQLELGENLMYATEISFTAKSVEVLVS